MNLKDVVLQLTIRMVLISTTVHEYGHLLALRVMGYAGEIRSSALSAVYPTDVVGITQREKLFFYGSGGFFQALIFLALCLWNKDEENRLVNKMIAVQGIIGGVFETLSPNKYWGYWGAISIIASFLFLGVVLIKNSQAQLPAQPTLD